jgi:hypothetical protein
MMTNEEDKEGTKVTELTFPCKKICSGKLVQFTNCSSSQIPVRLKNQRIENANKVGRITLLMAFY